METTGVRSSSRRGPPTCAEVQQQQQCAHAYLEKGSARQAFSRTEREPSRHVVEEVLDNIRNSRACFHGAFRTNPVVKMSDTSKATRTASAAPAGLIYLAGCIASFGGPPSVMDGSDCSQNFDDSKIWYFA